jgi:hypothetical protein
MRSELLQLAGACVVCALLGLGIERVLEPPGENATAIAFMGVVEGPGRVDGDFIVAGARGSIEARRPPDGRAQGVVTLDAGGERFTGLVTCLEVAPPRAIVGVQGVTRRSGGAADQPRTGLWTVAAEPGSRVTVFYDLRVGRTAPDCSTATFTRQLDASGTLTVRRVLGGEG